MKTALKYSIIILLSAFVAFPAFAENYKVDEVHSFVIFKIQHFNAGYVYGRFNQPGGQIVFNENAPEQNAVQITVKAVNIDTGNVKRDGHLKSQDFFNIIQFSEITFKSSEVKRINDTHYKVKGVLTLLKTSKELEVDVLKTGAAKDPWGKSRIGFETTFEIKRSDFGMNFMQGALSDEVTLSISLEGIKE